MLSTRRVRLPAPSVRSRSRALAPAVPFAAMLAFASGLGLTCLTAIPASADELQITPAADTPSSIPGPSDSVARPVRGMSMDKVEATYGAPAKRIPAVGTPPISRWEYPGYVVYFEGNLVIHSVAIG